MMEWTKITPDEFEAIGFKDLYEEDEFGKGNGHLAEYEYKETPYWITRLELYYLATHWQLNLTDAQDGDLVFDIVTKEDFNNVMKEYSIDLKL